MPLAESSAAVVSRLFEIDVSASAARAPSHVALPSASAPQMYIPALNRSTVWGSTTAYNRLRPARRQVSRLGAGLLTSATLSTALRRFMPGDAVSLVERSGGQLLANLQRIVDREDLCFAVGTPSIDAWWKPTLQLFDVRGNPVAYAKIGYTPLTKAMVETEGAALAGWANDPPKTFRVPALLGRCAVDDLSVVVSAPMPKGVRRSADTAEVATEILIEMAGVPSGDDPFSATRSEWWTTVENRHAAAESIVAGIAGFDHLVEVAGPTMERCDGRFGRWHGDWVPWNTAVQRTRGGAQTLWVWDWEYAASSAPVGLDVRHRAYQVHRVVGGHSVADSLDFARSSTASVLSGLGLGADQQRLLDVAHPVELLARHRRAAALGAPVHDEVSDLSDALLAVVDRSPSAA